VVRKVNRRYGVTLASMLLLIPCFISAISNLLVSGRMDWSVYVIGACFLAYVFILFPQQLQKPNAYLLLTLDMFALLGYLAVINIATGMRWFLRLGLPLVLVATSFALVLVLLIRARSIGILQKSGVLFLHISVLLIAINTTVNLFINKTYIPSWALFASVPCVVISAVFFYTNSHYDLKERIRKRLFY